MTTATSIRWHVIALGCAKDAHENHFSSRRGVWHFEDLDVLVLYNNNPYAKLPNLRDEETAEFRRRLAAEGIQELGYATYPPPSETDDQEAEQFSRKMAAKGIKTIVHKGGGYTYALVIKAGRDREDWVVQTMNEILADSFKRLAVEE